MARPRETRPELFRLVLMAGIVLYHLLLHAVPGSETRPLLAVVRTLLHVGVPCFVLLSGWFGIRPSVRVFFRLWSMCFFYGVLLFAVSLAAGWSAWSPRTAASAFLPLLFSGEWWFVTVYLALYLVAPILESFAAHAPSRSVWLSVAALFFLSFYVGHGPHNGSFAVGKNLCHFMFLYLLGNRLRVLPPRIGSRLSSVRPCIAFAAFVSLVCAFCSPVPLANRVFSELFFAYNAPFLVLLSVFVFLAFLRPFRRSGGPEKFVPLVNSLAMSVFPVYLLHENGFVSPVLHGFLRQRLFDGHSSGSVLLRATVAAAAVFAVCLLVDLALRPVHAALAGQLAKLAERTGTWTAKTGRRLSTRLFPPDER